MELDATRLSELRVFSEAELREISVASIHAVAELLDEVDAGLAGGELLVVAESAHRAHNEALLVGARELSAAFGALEHAARDGRQEAARDALGQARAVWPRTRSAIAALGDQDATD